ncbi:MAG: GerMN domain-containing protein [Dermatophilaceae bacterium]
MALASCGGLPDDSPVFRGIEVGTPVAPSVRQHFADPTPGASPEVIVRAFVVTGAAPAENYGAARKYLARNIVDTWAPRSRPVVIMQGVDDIAVQPILSTSSTRVVRISGPAKAVVAVNGRLTELADQIRSVQIELVRQDGDWRVSAVPADFGLWLDQFDFDAAYGVFTIGYVSTTSRTVLPDRRWFPITNALPTTLARAQLEPVPPYLSGAAESGFPLLTRLRVDAVTVTDGVANLDLTPQALGGTADDRRAAFAQAILSMTQAPSVHAVSMQVNGQSVGVSGMPDALSSLVDLGYEVAGAPPAERVVLRRGTALDVVLMGDLRAGQSRAEEPFLPALDVAWRGLAVSPDFKDLAATSGDGKGLLRWRRDGAAPGGPGRSALQPPFARDLVRPSYDASQGLWVGGATEAGEAGIWVIDTRGEVGLATPRRIPATWLAGSRITALKVAPDGQRVALLLAPRTGPARLAVAGIERGEDGRAASLADPLYVGGSLVSATEVSWESGYSVAVVGRAVGMIEDHALLVGVDGRLDGRLGKVPADAAGGRAVGSGAARGLLLVTRSGKVYQAIAGGWRDLATAGDLVVPGG